MAAKSVYLTSYSYFSWKISSRNAGLVQHFANCIAGFVVCRSLDSRNIVPSCRTGTSSEIRNDNLQVTVTCKVEKEKTN